MPAQPLSFYLSENAQLVTRLQQYSFSSVAELCAAMLSDPSYQEYSCRFELLLHLAAILIESPKLVQNECEVWG